MGCTMSVMEGQGRVPGVAVRAALDRAVAEAAVAGPRAGLDEIDRLSRRLPLSGGHSLPALRAELLRRLGRKRAAATVFLQAAALTDRPALRKVLRRRGVELLVRRTVRRRTAPTAVDESLPRF